jgi:hypothetical protein
MKVTKGSILQIGDLANYAMFAPVRRPTNKSLRVIAETNEVLFNNGQKLFAGHLDKTCSNAPISYPFRDFEYETVNQWNRVKKEENRQGIQNLVRSLAGVPFKVGIWMDKDGRFTDLRFGHWGIRSLHIGSSIYAKAHAVALLMPHEEQSIPMEVYFLDISPSVREKVSAWLWRYSDAQRWYRDLDKHFKVSPFVKHHLERTDWMNKLIVQSNTAHFDALRAPILRLPIEKYRVLPGNEAEHKAAAIADDGTRKIFQTRRTEDDEKPYSRVLNTPIRQSKTKPKNAFLFEVGINMYVRRLQQKGMRMPDSLSALSPLMTEVEDKWGEEPPETLENIRRFIEFNAGVPLKAALWFDVRDYFTNIRFSEWGGYMLHLGASTIAPSDAVAYLIPYGDSFIPMRAIVTAPYAKRATESWLAHYDEGQSYYRNLARRFGIWDFLKAQKKKFRATNTLCKIAGICHAQEVQAPLLGFAPGVFSAFATNAASAKTILHSENGRWMIGVPEGREVGIDFVSHGAGIHETHWNARFSSGGSVYRLGQGPAGYEWISV